MISKKYATFHMLILNEDKYIDGACISVSTYREYGNNEIEHNIMIDKSISTKGIKKLKKYFDNVMTIPLKEIDSNFQLRTKKLEIRYGKLIDYAWTKWYVLWFDSYVKVLFCDIDTLAVDSYVNIFEISTPAWCTYQKVSLQNKRLSLLSSSLKSGDVMTDTFIKKYTKHNIKNLCNSKNISFIPVNASIVLLSPSKEKFRKMKSYIDEQLQNYKMLKSISPSSGSDENLLFKFYFCKLQVPVYTIGPEYLATEWLLTKSSAFKFVKKPIILNYDTTDKPWLKNREKMYNEEKRWDELRKKYL